MYAMSFLIDWIKQNPIKGAAICFLVALLSLAAGIGIPSVTTQLSEQSAVQTIDAVVLELNETVSLPTESSPWFNSSYLRDEQGEFADQLIAAQQLIEEEPGARQYLTQARSPTSSTSQRIGQYDQAKESALEADGIARKIELDLLDSLIERDRARSQLAATVADQDELSGRNGAVLERFSQESVYYISTYITPLSEAIDATQQVLLDIA